MEVNMNKDIQIKLGKVNFSADYIDDNKYVVNQADITSSHTISQHNDVIEISTEIINSSQSDINLHDILILSELEIDIDIDERLSKVFIEPQALLGSIGIQDFDKEWESYGIVGFTNPSGTKAMLFGFEDLSDSFYRFSAHPTDKGFKIKCISPRDGAVINGSEKIKLSNLIIYCSDSLSNCLEHHAQRIKNCMGSRVNQLSSKTGWCSWYNYYGLESQADIISEVNAIAESEFADKIQVIQIDDGWNLPTNEHPCVWGDWFSGEKFPQGMKYISDYIHSKGFESGLWLAPFAVSKDSNLFKEHPEWLLGGTSGLLDNQADVYGLDTTNPEVQDFLKKTFTRVFDEWGFDYIKIDFLQYGAMDGERYDKKLTNAQAYRMGLECIRKVAKNRFILACGSPILQSAGLVDGMRIGSDVGSTWHFPLNEPNWQHGNCSIKPSIKYTVARQWMNGILWQNDPDCIVARDRYNDYELSQFKKWFASSGITINDELFGLSETEALSWIKTVLFNKGMILLSESINSLSKTRRELINKVFDDIQFDSKLIDYYQDNQVFVQISNGDSKYIAIFNISDEAVRVELPASRIGIKRWKCEELFDRSTFEEEGKTIIFAKQKAREAKIWCFKEYELI